MGDGGVPKWLRERSAKPPFSGSNPLAASKSFQSQRSSERGLKCLLHLPVNSSQVQGNLVRDLSGGGPKLQFGIGSQPRYQANRKDGAKCQYPDYRTIRSHRVESQPHEWWTDNRAQEKRRKQVPVYMGERRHAEVATHHIRNNIQFRSLADPNEECGGEWHESGCTTPQQNESDCATRK